MIRNHALLEHGFQIGDALANELGAKSTLRLASEHDFRGLGRGVGGGGAHVSGRLSLRRR